MNKLLNILIIIIACVIIFVLLERREPVYIGEPNSVESTEVSIEIGLPTRVFIGTPPNLSKIPNLESFSEKERSIFYAPVECMNIALNKTVTSSDDMPIIGEIELITDGIKEAPDGYYVELAPMIQYITIDLEQECEIYAVIMWHYHKQPRVYKDVIVQLSSDPDFIEFEIIFNNDFDNSSGMGIGEDLQYIESYNGKLIDAKGKKARYVRCWSNGNNENDLNNYIEVSVYGRIINE